MKYRIREYRKARKWTLADLGEVAGTSPGHLSDIETGKREPGPKMLEDIAKALNVTVAQLYIPQDEDEELIISHMSKFEKLSDADRAAVEKLTNALLSQQDG